MWRMRNELVTLDPFVRAHINDVTLFRKRVAEKIRDQKRCNTMYHLSLISMI